MRFEKFLNEHYLNIFKKEDRKFYAEEVWNLLQSAYASVGGIKGKGFSSKEDMIDSIHMWKMNRKNGKINVVFLYKDSNGRKLVAGATDGTSQGKSDFRKMFKEELTSKRSYGEISHSVLRVAQEILGPELKNYLVKADDVKDVLSKNITKVDDFHYSRNIGGFEINKVMYGIPGIKIF